MRGLLVPGAVVLGVLVLVATVFRRRVPGAPIEGGDHLEAGRLYHVTGDVAVPAPDGTGQLTDQTLTLRAGWIVGVQDEFGRPWQWGALRPGELGACGLVLWVLPPSPTTCTRPLVWAAGVTNPSLVVQRLLIASGRLEVR